jgi:hypothetical protein
MQRDALHARSDVARLEARFWLLLVTHVCTGTWHLFALMDVPRRIARERVPGLILQLLNSSKLTS